MASAKTPAPETVDPLAAFDALRAEPAPLTDGAIRCMLAECNGIVRKDFVFTFSDAGGDEHKLGVCYNRTKHLALLKRNAFTKADLRRAMDVLDRAVAQNS